MHPTRPHGRPAMFMRWESLLFIHWRVNPEAIQPLLPPGLVVDTFDGSAWVGLIPFTMPRVRHAFMPPIPTMRAFHECNVRTYVKPAAEDLISARPGVWFFSLDAMSRLAVWGVRSFWNLNYNYASIDMRRENHIVRYAVNRLHAPRAAMRCAWRIGSEVSPSPPGSLPHFLTERYCLYASSSNRRSSTRLLRSDIHHVPWTLREASLLELDDSLVRAAGINLNGSSPASVLHANAMDVEAWPLR